MNALFLAVEAFAKAQGRPELPDAQLMRSSPVVGHHHAGHRMNAYLPTRPSSTSRCSSRASSSAMDGEILFLTLLSSFA